MNNRKTWFFGSLITLITILALLVTGSSILVEPLCSDPYIPMGTPATWIGMISFPLAIYFGIEKIRNPANSLDVYLSGFLRVTLVLSLLWAPICYLLAGNFSYSFTEKAEFQGGQLAMRWFWRFSYGIVILPLVILAVHWVFLLVTKLRS